MSMLLIVQEADAQVLKKIIKNAEKKIENEAEKRTQKRVDKAIDKTFDKIEGAIDSTAQKATPDKSKEGVNGRQADKQSPEKNSGQADKQSPEDKIAPEQSNDVLQWSKYDFIPGTELIFEDDLATEQNGEFPGKWDMKSGVIENAVFNGEKVIFFRETGNMPNGIVPLISDSPQDYLPDEFTIEFDCYFHKDLSNRYRIYLFDSRNQKTVSDLYMDIRTNSVVFTNISEKQFPNTVKPTNDKESKWRHISISFNKRALKVYMDDNRMINIPNITNNPTGLTISADHASADKNFFVKSIRIAKGAVPLYDKILTDGKFVTTGIKFDVNKESIKPESAGTINYVVKMMQDYPQLRFCIEGHTDSDGQEAFNQTLSEKRALSVRDALIASGVSADRITTKGWGETKPVSDNYTPEGKAQNRRVEFIKID